MNFKLNNIFLFLYNLNNISNFINFNFNFSSFSVYEATTS